MTQILEEYEMENSAVSEAIRFLLMDGAFEKEFILTTILEYIANSNKPKDNA